MPPRLIKALVFIGVWLEESAFRLSKGSAFVGGAVAVIGIPVMNCWPPREDNRELELQPAYFRIIRGGRWAY